MNLERVQNWVAAQAALPDDRWLLRTLAYGGALIAMLATEHGAGSASVVVVFLIGGLALLATFGPDSHVSSLVVLAVGWRWLASVADPLAWPVVAVAIGLFLHHAACALLAAAPDHVELPGSVYRRWVVRSLVVVAVTVASWLLVVVLDGRSLGGSVVLTAAALVAVVGGAVVVVLGSLERASGDAAGP